MDSESTEKVDIIITGLVRAVERFKQSITDYVKLRKEGYVDQIIFSTWDYEVEKNPEVMKFLKKNRVDVIPNKEPSDRGRGNIWCQMKSLDVALSRIKPDRFVLKSRSDYRINPDFLRKLFKEKERLLEITSPLPKGNIFKYKVWVPYFEIKTPFHMGEECFFGHHHDLKLLVNYDDSYDKKYKVGGAISHIRRLIHPFRDHYDILKTYLESYSNNSKLKNLAIKFSKKVFDFRGSKVSRKLSAQNKIANLRRKLNDNKFIEILAAYYSILNSHFYIDGNSFKNQIIGSVWSVPGPELDEKNFANNLLTNEKFHQAQPGQIYSYDNKILESICNKKLEKDNISERLMQAIDRFNSPFSDQEKNPHNS